MKIPTLLTLMAYVLTTSWNQNTSRDDMHPRHARHDLRTRQNHTPASEDIIDEIQQDEDAVREPTVPMPHKLQRRMRVRHAEFGHNAQKRHECDLEG
jgi:hypothetical protein